jgi:ABC-type Na+ efflux pump permease subunit
MLKKECLEAIKRLLESLLILVVFPLAIVWDKLVAHVGWPHADAFKAGVVATLVVYDIYSGATIFLPERKDKAFEYLFSLPLSRSRIVMAKVLPRFAILVLLFLLSAVIIGPGILASGIIFILLFFGAVSLSVAVGSVILNIIGVSFLFGAFQPSCNVLSFLFAKLGMNFPNDLVFIFGQIGAALLILVPLWLAFWLTFKKLDVKPIRLQMNTYYSILLPSVVGFVAFILLFYRKAMYWIMAR